MKFSGLKPEIPVEVVYFVFSEFQKSFKTSHLLQNKQSQKYMFYYKKYFEIKKNARAELQAANPTIVAEKIQKLS